MSRYNPASEYAWDKIRISTESPLYTKPIYSDTEYRKAANKAADALDELLLVIPNDSKNHDVIRSLAKWLLDELI